MGSRIEKIDAHVHSYEGIKAPESLLKLMDSAELAAVSVASLPTGILEKYSHYDTTCATLLAKALHPGSFYCFASLDYRKGADGKWGADFKEQAQEAIAAGADGIKMLEGKPDVRKGLGMPLDDTAYDAFYSFMEAERIPLLLHVTDPEEFWDREKAPKFAFENNWFWGDGTYSSKESLYQETENVLKKHPRLNLILAHFFFLSADISRAEGFLSRYPSVSFDITPGTEMFFNFSKRRGEWRDFFVRNSSRIIYGSDSTDKPSSHDWYFRLARNLRAFLETEDNSDWGKGLGLDAKSCELIYAGNFKAKTGGAPKPVRKAEALKLCRKALESARLAGKAGEPSAVQLKAILEKLSRI